MKRDNRRSEAAKKSVTLRDVAVAAGTTPMTVSNVLNNRAGSVSAGVAKHVQKIALDLGYRPHAPARRLRTQRNQAIGVVLVDPSPYFLSDPLSAAMLAGLTAVLGRRNYGTVLHGIRPDEVEHASFMRAIETDGVCLILSGSQATRHRVIERVEATNQPLIVIQEELPDAVSDGACIYLDDRRGARALARQILPADAADVLLMVPAVEWPAMARREAGIRDAIEEVGGEARLRVVRTADEGFDACQAALAAHIRRYKVPDVVIGGNDQMAIAAMKHLQDISIDVPNATQVAGFNGLEFRRYATPELTTVLSPAFSVGEAAASAILTRLEHGAFPFRELVIPVEVAFRGSTGFRSPLDK